jgi:outer membrane receptor protein involved in Fe transport
MRNLSIAFSGAIAILFACLVSVSTPAGLAQTFRGSIQGTITDSSGAVVPGAQVKVFSPSTGLSRSITANDQGEYAASELPLGTYSVTVEKKGFRTTTLTEIPVSVGSPTRADVKLAAGAVSEVIEVNATVALVETASNTTGATIEAAQASELPVNGHDYTKLLELVPGATSDPVGSTESAGSYGLFSLNGNRGRSNNYLLDGTDMNDGYRNLPTINQAGVWGCPGTILPVDALAEIPVTGSPEAEFGRSSGATVNIVTKSGTNAFHGSAFEYYRDGAMSARNFFNTDAQPKNSFTNHQFGGMIDGPIVRDHTFFLLAYEGQREDGGLPQLGTAPLSSDVAGYTGYRSTVMANIMKTNPWGTLPTSANAVTYTTPFHNVSDNAIVKADQHLKLFSPEDLLTGRYFYAHGMQSFPLGMLYSGTGAPGYNTLTPTHINIVSLSYTSIPKPNLIFEVRGGYNRFLQQFLPQDIGVNPQSAYGLNSLPPDFSSHDLGLPFISISSCTLAGSLNNTGSCSTLGATSSDARGRIDSNYQLFGNVSLTKGRHSYKAGYEWRRTFINSFIDSGHRGSLTFNTLSDFLAGSVDSGSSADFGSGARTVYSFQNASGVYFMDSWRATPKVTVNAGLRWDYFGVIGAKNNAFTLPDLTETTPTLETVGASNGPSSLYAKDWTTFSPRISLAYDLKGNGKLVIRTGAGIYPDGPSQDFFVGNLTYNMSPSEEGPAYNTILFTSFSSPVSVDTATHIFDPASYSPTNSYFSVAKNLVTPRYVSYNLNIQSQLAKAVAVQIGYVGSQGRHLFHFRDLNQPNIESGKVFKCANGITVAYGSTCYTTGYLDEIETSAESNYNSLQTSLKLQNLHGLTSTLNYTWAHSIDTASDGQDFVPNAAMPDDSFNPHGEYASSNFNIRQRVQWYWTYNLPKFHQARWITNGWALDGIFNFATGQPYTVHYFGNYNGSGEGFGRFDIANRSKLRQGVGGIDPATGGVALLNMAAFAPPCTWDPVNQVCASNSGHPGSEGRNAFNSPNFTNFDFSMNKTTHLNEKMTVELRADFFNIFNHPNLSNPLMPSFGLFASPSQQFVDTTATPDVATGNPYLGGGGPRSAQLAVHFIF